MTGKDTDPRDSLAQRDIGPVVPLPRAGVSGAAIALTCGALGLVLFLVLDTNRRALNAPATEFLARPSAIASPPPLGMPQPPPVIATMPAVPTPPQAGSATPRSNAAPFVPPPPYAPSPAPLPSHAPEPVSVASNTGGQVLLIDMGEATTAGGAPVQASGEAAPAGDDQAVRATIIRNRASLVPQGTLIPAVLETPIDSTRAGPVRALVSRDVRGFDGTRVLIPRGSRLIGEARGDAQPGQKRVLVTWTRLIRPDGVAIRIGSPGADHLGGAGLEGRVNTHFLERFANAVLQSAFSIGVNRAARPREGSVVVGLPGQLGDAINQVPIFNAPAGPTIKVGQGAEIAIFVARDLDFGVVAQRQ